MSYMAQVKQRVRPWQAFAILGSIAAFFMAIPSFGRAHPWVYWAAGCLLELLIIVLVLRAPSETISKGS